jgi:tetratricopeptide (TPR) repeat protein
MRSAVRMALVAIAVGLATPAAAQDRAAARQAYTEGSKHYDLNQYAEALEAFKRAYWNYEDPVFLYNIAQCHRALKHKSEAIDFYRSYLRKAPNARNRAEVQRIMSELEAAVAQEKRVALGPPEGTMPGEARPAAGAANAAPASSRSPAAASGAAPTELVTSAAPAARADKPLWKRGWFWGVTAASVAVVAGVAVGISLGTAPRDPSPSIGRVQVN